MAELQSNEMFGYMITAFMRQPDRKAGEYAYEHWRNYQELVWKHRER